MCPQGYIITFCDILKQRSLYILYHFPSQTRELLKQLITSDNFTSKHVDYHFILWFHV